MIVSEAVEALYTVFADAPRPERVDGCTNCCTTADRLERLATVPLRELTAAEIRDYAVNANSTVGSVADFLYLMPRVLEVCWNTEFHMLEALGGAIARTDPDNWPLERQAALDALFAATLDQLDESPKPTYDIDTMVTSIGLTGRPIAAHLAALKANPALLAALHSENAHRLSDGRLANLFWLEFDTSRPRPSAAANYHAVVSFLTNHEVEDIVTEYWRNHITG